MKKSIFLIPFLILFLSIPDFSQRHDNAQTKDFCAFFINILNNCNNDFKSIRGNMVDSTQTDVGYRIDYMSKEEFQDAIISAITIEEAMGYMDNYFEAHLGAYDLKIFGEKYGKYKKLLDGCTALKLAGRDSAAPYNHIVKDYPDLVYVKKEDKADDKLHYPNSIQIHSDYKGGELYDLTIKVVEKMH